MWLSVQVLHGCSSDVLWLQRDFGVYLVNVFDTGEASKLLHYPSHGLAHLLHTFCGVVAQKQYQVQWRLPIGSRVVSCRCRCCLRCL